MGKSSVLVVGNGGREHALAWKLRRSPRVSDLYVAPGNGGTRRIAENVAIGADDINELMRFAYKKAIGLTVVGPDNPLALGIACIFRSQGLRIFGPTCEAAEIEYSKAYAKGLMEEEDIPTAPFLVFSDYDEALAFVRQRGAPIVVKASGLALGKGAYVCKSAAEAENALAEIMVKRVHREAGDEVVIEEFLEGPEISIHAFSDGKTSILLPPAQDHKPIGDGDKGKNTGGMGTIVPVPWVDEHVLRSINDRIVRPALGALAKRERPFSGLFYPGIKMTSDGPKVLEFNARFGDPETQSYMRLLNTDLFDILKACADGKLADLAIEWRRGFAACVVIASGGYPDNYKKGVPIYGIADAEQIEKVVVFHAGTSFDNGELKTSGGRVLGVTAVGDTLQDALDRAYEAARLIRFEGIYYRRDIGANALAIARELAANRPPRS